MARNAERQHPRGPVAHAPGRPARVGSGSLTAKLGVCVLAFGLIGAGLLSTRQSRLQAAHEVTAARLRIREHDERLLALRAEIAQHVSPAAVRRMLERHGGVSDLAPVASRARRLPSWDPSEAEFDAESESGPSREIAPSRRIDITEGDAGGTRLGR